MNCRHHVLFLLLATPGLAQAEATTLHELLQRADATVIANVQAATDPSPEFHRLQLRVDETLRGNAPPTLSLLEPSGRCCGRALHTLAVGHSYLLFLRRQGPTWHVEGAERGAVPIEPALLQHVRGLLAAATVAERTDVLVAGVGSSSPRARADAIVTLPTLADGPLPARAEPAIAAALATELAAGSTLLPPLLATAVRLRSPELTAQLLPGYLATPRADVARLLHATLTRLPADAVFAAVRSGWPDDDQRRLRAAELLADLEPALAQPLLRQLLTETASPRVSLAATEALLAQGVAAATLQARVPASVLDLAQRRQLARPRFANVRP